MFKLYSSLALCCLYAFCHTICPMNTGLAVPPAQAEAVSPHQHHHSSADQSDATDDPCSQCALKASAQADRQALPVIQQPPVLPVSADLEQLAVPLQVALAVSAPDGQPPGSVLDDAVVLRL